jgi:hypothetical protein
MNSRALSKVAAAAAVIWLLGATPPLALAQSTPAGPVDPVVADVVKMLDAGVEPELVLRWLDSGAMRPAPLSADDIIALSQAKAPKEIIQALLDLAAGPPAPEPTPRSDAAPAPPAAPADSRSAAAAADAGDCCLVDVSIEFRAPLDIEGDNTVMPARDLFVYVDGEFLARVTSTGNIASKGPVGLKTRLDPGTHYVRLTRELHMLVDDFGKAPAWSHTTTVSPVALEIEVEPGGQYNLDLRWVEGEFSIKNPFSFRWSRNGAEIASEKHFGEFSEKWPYLCEDVEASRATGAISKWRTRERLDDCVHWAELWPAPVPMTRKQILAQWQEYDFNPPVSYVGRLD